MMMIILCIYYFISIVYAFAHIQVPELKQALKEKGLPVSGSKAELIKRLGEALGATSKLIARSNGVSINEHCSLDNQSEYVLSGQDASFQVCGAQSNGDGTFGHIISHFLGIVPSIIVLCRQSYTKPLLLTLDDFDFSDLQIYEFSLLFFCVRWHKYKVFFN